MAKPKKSKRFEYNLKTVLKHREIKEKEEQDKYQKAERQFQEEKRKEEQMKREQEERYHELAAEMQGGQAVDLQHIFMRQAHLEVLKEQVIVQEKKRYDAEDEKKAQQERLIQAVKEKKILEKDKEKKKEQWRKLMVKEENKFLDDIANIGFVRKHYS